MNEESIIKFLEIRRAFFPKKTTLYVPAACDALILSIKTLQSVRDKSAEAEKALRKICELFTSPGK